MNAAFLHTILPPLQDGETYFAVGLAKGQPPDVAACPSVEHLLRRGELHVRYDLDSYMALGSFGAGGRRTKDNARRFKALWVDIDVAKTEDGHGYASQSLALADALLFMKRQAMPCSGIVSSGRGLHIYWALQDATPVDVWLPLALGLKELCVKEGLHIDPVCTADAARILRIPGTVHQGTGNVVTLVVNTGTLWSIEALQGKLPAVEVTTPALPPAAVGTDGLASLFGMGAEPPKAYAERIVSGCSQLATMGHGREPQWYLAMNVLARCVDGREWAHKLSAMDEARYEFAQTDAKFDRAKPDSPTTCATFANANPEGCKGCVYQGRIKSPIELHRYVQEASVQESVEEEPADDGHIHIPEAFPTPRVPFVAVPHANFRVDDAGIHHITAEKNKDTGEWEERDTLICRTQLYFKRTDITYEDATWNTDYVFDAVYPDGAGTRELHLLVSAYYASPERWWADHMIHVTNTKHKATLMTFINAYLEQVVHKSPVRHKHKNYGWTEIQNTDGEKEMGFVTEGCVITAEGALPASFDRLGSDPTRQVFTRKGTLEAWTTAAKIYRILNQPLGQMAMCFSLAAPLMKYGSGEAKNCFFNIYSVEGGKGKSHTLRFAASIWGNPAKSFFQKDSSIVARQKRLALWQNLPAMMDEVSHMSEEDMSNLVFSIITGEEKQKLTPNSDFRVTGNWSTCVLATSNRPVKELLAAKFGTSDAGLLRAMDVHCDFQTLDPASQEMQCLNACVRLINDNYGLAGPEFIYQLLRRPERLHMLETAVAGWVATWNFPPQERFYSYPIGLALQAGKWAVEFGLLDYDMTALELWVREVMLPQLREADQGLVRKAEDVLSTYIHERIVRHAVIVRRKMRLLDKEPEQVDSSMPDAYVLRRPTQALLMRYEVENMELSILGADFDSWCSNCGWSALNTVRELRGKRILLPNKQRVTLGKQVPWLPQTRTMCYTITKKGMKLLGLDTTIQTAIANSRNAQEADDE